MEMEIGRQLTTCLSDEQIVAFLEGALLDEKKAIISSHMAICPKCRKDIKMTWANAMIKEPIEVPEPTEDFLDSILEGLEKVSKLTRRTLSPNQQAQKISKII
ncbi:hypothetical protein CL633_01770 [bacterium]|nr:hypothetical protein [bacterium]|tara:strand:+ start:2348 stop:2656 length:309 start_codon:yes stop_codon:yes gene_type:complete